VCLLQLLNQIVCEFPPEHPLSSSRPLRELLGHTPLQVCCIIYCILYRKKSSLFYACIFFFLLIRACVFCISKVLDLLSNDNHPYEMLVIVYWLLQALQSHFFTHAVDKVPWHCKLETSVWKIKKNTKWLMIARLETINTGIEKKRRNETWRLKQGSDSCTSWLCKQNLYRKVVKEHFPCFQKAQVDRTGHKTKFVVGRLLW